MSEKPNVLFIMTDQQRFDTIAALGNEIIYTPNMDRLVRRGVSFVNGYSTCPVCVPARYTIRTGCEPVSTGVHENSPVKPREGWPDEMEDRCGPYLARTMNNLGYRTFGIGKFHSQPWFADLGYEVHLHSEEGYGNPQHRARDDYAAYVTKEWPQFDFVEQLMGERTEMYYMPQTSSLPAEACVESWSADRAVEQLAVEDKRPYFGFVSFIAPHPPLAPPIPFNRLYDPDKMPNPVRGDRETDLMDEQIEWMNKIIWADDISDLPARIAKTRYYGELTFTDHCLGRILDAVEARDDAHNTLICFFSDHGDHLGDHHAWQKESFFEQSCHVPFLVSWPKNLPADVRREELVCLTDLFAIATGAAGATETRDGIDVLGVLNETANAREYLFGYYGEPGTPLFKIMVRDREWKYIYMANGGREQLFNMNDDPQELTNLAKERPEVLNLLREVAVSGCQSPGGKPALDGTALRSFPFKHREVKRIHQFARYRGVKDFPNHPKDVLDEWEKNGFKT